MKSILVVLLVGVLMQIPAFAGDRNHNDNANVCIKGFNSWNVGDVKYRVDDGTLIITHKGRHREMIEITEDYDLYINGKYIKLDSEQQELVAEYYDKIFEITRQAKRIGWEGAKIGLKGAEIGFQAICGVFKMVFTDYDEDDLDHDMKRASSKIEAKADILEEKAKALEKLAEELEWTADNMKNNIPELKKMEWF